MRAKLSSTPVLAKLREFLKSPFKDDRKYTIKYVLQLTRDRIDECKDQIEALFYDDILNIFLKPDKDDVRMMIFDILCNLVGSEYHRNKLAT